MWHAKRFYMKKKFGYTIAQKRLDKGYKASYRYSKYFSCVYDSSYMNYVIITSTDALSLFKYILDNYSIDHYENIKEFHSYKAKVFYMSKLVGPAEFILLDGVILVKFHPLMKDEILDLFKQSLIVMKEKFNAEILYNKRINTFNLLGPKALDNLLKIFKALDTDGVIDYDNFINLVTKSQNGKGFIFKLKKPIAHFKMNEFVFNRLSSNIVPMNVEYPHDHMERLSTLSNDGFVQSIKDRSQSLIDAITNLPKEPSVEIKFDTERTLFVHRKKVELKQLNEKLNKSMRFKKRKENLVLQPKKEAAQIKTNTLSEIVSPLHNDETTHILLIKQNLLLQKENNFPHNIPMYTLVFPRGYSVDLLRRFVYLGTRPYGLKEFNYYLNRNDQLVFPEDYPSTNSYLKHMKLKVRVI